MHVNAPDGARITIHTTGRGTPVLFVHGTAGDHADWDAVTAELPDFACHLMDRRGRGASSDGPRHSLAAEAADVRAAAEAVGAQAIVAHSFGALVTLEAAASPGLPPCLLYEPPLTADGVVERAKPLEALLAKRDLEGVVSTFLTDFTGAAPGDVAMFRRTPGWRSAVGAAPTIPREVRAFLTFRFQPARYRARPTAALLQGSDSPALLRAAVRQVADAWRAPVHVLAHQGHEALTTAPDEVARQVQAFMAYARRQAARPVAPL